MFTEITKIIKLTATLAAAAFFLTGCFPTGEKSVTENAGYAEIKKRADNINNFNLDLQLPENIPESVPTVRLTMKELNVDDIYKTFGEGGTVISNEEYPSDYFEDAVYHVDKLDNGITLIYERGRLSMRRSADAEAQNDGDYQLLSSMIDEIYFDAQGMTADLQDFTREDAMKKANEIFDKLGIKIYGDPQIFALNAELAQTLMDEYAWNGGSGAYYMIYPAVIEGVPLLSKRANLKMGLFLAVSPVKMVISKDRTEIFSCGHLYDNDFEKVGETPIKFNAAQALDVLVSYYEPQALADEVGFISCELVYVPTERSDDIISVVYKPAWLFTGYAKSEYSPAQYKYELVYADTGARAVTG